MASKKGGSRASSGGGESNTGLVVSLVIFIILTIALGVTTFLGYSKVEDAEKHARDEAQKATEAQNKARNEEAQKLALRNAIGAPVSEAADKTGFAGVKQSANAAVTAETNKINDALTALLRSLSANKTLDEINPDFKRFSSAKWDVAAHDEPPRTIMAIVTDLEKAFKALQSRRDADTVAFNEAKDNLTKQLAEIQGRLDKAQTDLKEANDKLVAEENRKEQAFDKSSGDVKKLSEQLAKLTVEKDNIVAEKDAIIRKLNNQIENMTKVRDTFRGKVGPVLEKLERIKLARPEISELAELHELLLRQFEGGPALSNDTPKGEIVKMDRATGLAYVNLGTADYIRPGVTFSILPAGSTGRAAASRQRKGAIEIVEALEPHLSSAKVIEATNAVRDPLLPGDLLFNPAWGPNSREHVAIAGIIDLNGDGIDDTRDLINTLERQGVVVDAYLDLKERTIKGPGITEKTTYLILGEKPTLPPNVQLDNNPVTKAALDVIGKMEEMKKKVIDVGAQTVSYRRFLLLMGFKLPKVSENAEVGASSYLHGTQSTGGSSESPEGKPK